MRNVIRSSIILLGIILLLSFLLGSLFFSNWEGWITPLFWYQLAAILIVPFLFTLLSVVGRKVKPSLCSGVVLLVYFLGVTSTGWVQEFLAGSIEQYNAFRFGATLLLAAGFISLIHAKRKRVKTRVDYRVLELVASGQGVFRLLMSAAVACLLMIQVVQRDWSCQRFYDDIENIGYASASLLGVSPSSVPVFVSDVKRIGSNSVSDLIGMPQEDVQKLEEAFSGGNIASLISELSPVYQEETFTGSILPGFMGMMTQNVLTQISRDSSLIRAGVCDVVSREIEREISKGWVSYSLVFLLFFFLSPIMNLLFRVTTLVWALLFKLLILLRVFRREKVMREVKQLT